MPIFFILSEIKEFVFLISGFSTFHLMKTTTPGPYNAQFNTLLTPTVSQTKLPQQLDFWTIRLQ